MGTCAPRSCERSADHDRFRARGRTRGPRRRRARNWGKPSEPMGGRAGPAFRDRAPRRAVPFHQAVRCSCRTDREYGAIGHISQRCDAPAALLPPGVDGMAVGVGQLRPGPHAQLAQQRGDHASPGFDATATRFVVRVRALPGDILRPHAPRIRESSPDAGGSRGRRCRSRGRRRSSDVMLTCEPQLFRVASGAGA